MHTPAYKDAWHRVPFRAMGGPCELVLAADSPERARALAGPAVDEVLRIERKYSRYARDSVVSAINAGAGGAPVECDEETLSLMGFADQLHRQSGGLFDITSGVLRRTWNFDVPVVPSEAALAPLLALVGWGRVDVSGGRVRLPLAGMELDLGGFGKEYAADRAAHVLDKCGVRHGYVNLSGDMRFLGPKPSGEPWMIGIQDPRVVGQVVATLPMSSGGLATSGDYERYFELGGARYCHVLSPVTGMPVTHWRTVSVTAPMAVLSGCCSTIAMLKQAEGLGFLQSCGFDYLAVDGTGAVHTRQARE